MSRMRQRIAERLKQSQNSAAALTTFNEIDMSSLMSMRSQYKDSILKEHGIKLGFMSAFARASCIALKEIPAANASVEGDGPGDQIVYRDYVDLSVAVATGKGLVTPVVRNAEGMSFLQIEQAISDLGKKVSSVVLQLLSSSTDSFIAGEGQQVDDGGHGWRILHHVRSILVTLYHPLLTSDPTARTEESSGHFTAPPSSTSLSAPSLECTPSRTEPLSLMDRLSSVPSWLSPSRAYKSLSDRSQTDRSPFSQI